MSNIPQEYLGGYDFGFSAVDEPPQPTYQAPQAPVVDTVGLEDNVARLEQEVARLGNRIETMITKLSGLDDEFDLVKQKTEEEIAQKVIDLEKIIMPLLINLLKTADKAYIHWPNRKDQIQSQIDRVLAITRG